MALEKDFTAFARLDPRSFPAQVKTREEAISAAEPAEIKSSFRVNALAAALHPETQSMVVKEIVDYPGADAKKYVLKTADGSPCAWFRAGQYLSIPLRIGGSLVTRPVSICSSPLKTRDGEYAIAVKRNPQGFASGYILDSWRVGTEVQVSGPQGDFVYEPLREARHVVALAGGSGITPFLSMAEAIRDGAEDFRLTVLFGSRTESGILFREELDAVAAACPKVRVVHVLSDEERPGLEHGFITAELIKKYAGGEPYSVFVCGPGAMYRFAAKECARLGLGRREARFEVNGVTKTPWEAPGYPESCRGKAFRLRVLQYDREYDVEAGADEPVLVAIERAGIAAPSRCRSGECAWCRSKLISGEVYVPAENDGRRAADLVHGYIHPCAAFPISDLCVELPGSTAQ